MIIRSILIRFVCLSAMLFSSSLFAKPMLDTAVAPQRIVSLNLCADQLLMEMLPPERLVGITHLSVDKGISYHYKKAENYHQHKGRIEEIIALKPDLIIAGQFTTQPTNQLLEKLGYSVLRIGLPKTIAEIKQQLTKLGQRVGAASQTDTIINDMSQTLFELNKEQLKNTPSAAIYYANGFSAGKETIVDEALRFAGFKNIAAEQGLDYIAPLSMEALIKAEPDVLILGRYQKNTDSMAHQVLKHRALQKFIRAKSVKTIAMPDRYWDCAGPSIVAAISHLQQGYRQQDVSQ